ncbi:hypothetical protein Tco_1136553 [Tanacetum coccineum]
MGLKTIKDNDNGSKSRSQCMMEQGYNKNNEDKDHDTRAYYDKSNLLIPTEGVSSMNSLRGEIVSLIFIESITEASSRVQDSLRVASRRKDGIFISQDKYVARILKKFGFTEVKTASTLMETQKPFTAKDEMCKKQTVVANSTTNAGFAGQKLLMLSLRLADAEGIDCFSNSTIFENLALIGNMKRVGKGFSGRVTSLFPTMVVQNQSEMGEGSAIHTDPQHIHTILHPSTSQPQKTQTPRELTRRDTEIPQSSGPTEHVADEVVHKEKGDSLVRVATTVSSLEAAQDNGNIDKTQSKETLNEPSSPGTSSGGGPRGNTLRSGEDSLKLKELMALCTNLQQRVLDLEKTKTTQAEEIVSLKRRVKKLEQKKRSRTHKLKRLRKVGAIARVESSGDGESLGEDASKQRRIDADDDITLVSAAGDKVSTIGAATISTKPKAKGIVFRKLGESTTTTIPIPSKIQDKGKAKMIEPKPLDEEERIAKAEEIALKLQAEIDEEERIAKAEEENIDKQKRKHFAAKKAEEKRNKPPTKVQQKKIMITYLKNMEGWKHKHLKSKDFDSIKELFDKALKRVDDVQETAKVDDDQEAAKIKELMEIVPDKEEVGIDAIPLAVKPPSIGRFGNSVEIEDTIWRNQQDYRVLEWKLYDSYGVHFLRMQHMQIYMLVEKKYHLTPATITDMLNNYASSPSKLSAAGNFNENYSKCLRLLVKLQLSVQSYYC